MTIIGSVLQGTLILKPSNKADSFVWAILRYKFVQFAWEPI
jgi:hypothetical protein